MTRRLAGKIVLSALSATLLSSGALAGEEAASARVAVSFETLDKNGDHQISRTEATAEKALSDSFAIVDTDGDGYVSKAEYMARTKS